MFGFAKNEKGNLAPDEAAAFKRAAKIVLALGDEAMVAEVECGRMREIGLDAKDL